MSNLALPNISRGRYDVFEWEAAGNIEFYSLITLTAGTANAIENSVVATTSLVALAYPPPTTTKTKYEDNDRVIAVLPHTGCVLRARVSRTAAIDVNDLLQCAAAGAMVEQSGTNIVRATLLEAVTLLANATINAKVLWH